MKIIFEKIEIDDEKWILYNKKEYKKSKGNENKLPLIGQF